MNFINIRQFFDKKREQSEIKVSCLRDKNDKVSYKIDILCKMQYN